MQAAGASVVGALSAEPAFSKTCSGVCHLIPPLISFLQAQVGSKNAKRLQAVRALARLSVDSHLRKVILENGGLHPLLELLHELSHDDRDLQGGHF